VLKRKVEEFYDRVAQDYDSKEHPFYLSDKLKCDATWHLIESRLPEDKTSPVLDAGGGTGLWTVRIAELGYDVVLADISQGMLDEARANTRAKGCLSRVRFVKADIADMSQSDDNCFSLILAEGGPLSYCEDVVSAMKGLHRILEPGGYLIGSVESKYTGARWKHRSRTWDEIKEALYSGTARDKHTDVCFTCHMYSSETIERALGQAGLSVEKIYGKQILPGLLGQERFDELAKAVPWEELLAMEQFLQDDPAVIASAWEIGFVARKELAAS